MTVKLHPRALSPHVIAVALLVGPSPLASAQPEIEPARQLIRMDYAAAFHALVPPAAEGERAYEVYLRSIEQLGEYADPEFYSAAMDGILNPEHGSWDAARTYLHQRSEALRLVRQGAAMDVFGAPLSISRLPDEAVARARRFGGQAPPDEQRRADAPLWFFHQPMVMPLREFAAVLRIDAVVAAGEGDIDRFLADISALSGVARHAREAPLLTNHSVAYVAQSLACDTVLWVLGEHPELLDGRQLEALQRTLQGMHVSFSTQGERLQIEEAIQRLYSDDGFGGGLLNVEGVNDFHAGDPESDFFGLRGLTPANSRSLGFLRLAAQDPGRRRVREVLIGLLDAADAESAKPAWEAMPHSINAEADRLDNHLIFRFTPAAAVVIRSYHRCVHSRDAALTAVALFRCRAETGVWPATLDDLVPEYLAAVPRDMFSGEPLRYRPPAAAPPVPVLYSVGSDRDDDGGKRMRTPDDPRGVRPRLDSRTPPDGDWVFLGG